MITTLNTVISKIYTDRDKVLIQSIKDFDTSEIYDLFKKHSFDNSELEFFEYPNDISFRIVVSFKPYNKDSYNITYSSDFYFSKAFKIYNLTNYFEVINLDPDQLTSTLIGDSQEAFSKTQYNFNEMLKDLLSDLEYQALSYYDMNTVVPIELPSYIPKVYGPQMTVENALFRVLLGILE